MSPLSVCLPPRVLGPWSWPSSWPPIHRRPARPEVSVPPSILPQKARGSCARQHQRFVLLHQQSAEGCRLQLANLQIVFQGQAGQNEQHLLRCVWVRLPLCASRGVSFSVASLPAFLTTLSRPSSAFLSKGKTVRKCSSNMATDSKC